MVSGGLTTSSKSDIQKRYRTETVQVSSNAMMEFFLRQFTVNFIYNNFLGV